MTDAWGDPKTRFFFELTPDRVIEAVEAAGLRCTGRCTALNSFENRVYEVELEEEEEGEESLPRNSLARRRVVKFYRPGRWDEKQILEEHEFLLDLRDEEIPVVSPIVFPDGKTLRRKELGGGDGLWYALFPKVGGRAPDELSEDQLLRIGRLLGRVHNVGAKKTAHHRVLIGPETYGVKNLESLLAGDWIPSDLASRYEKLVREICAEISPIFDALSPSAIQRVHGDCHLGNLLWGDAGPFFLDFDDMVRGPAAQDVWLLVPGRDEESVRNRALLLEGYEEMRGFDWSTLRLIEPLRALRFIHYSAWIARRWDDPAFPQAFPQFGTRQYWLDEIKDLETQRDLISRTKI